MKIAMSRKEKKRLTRILVALGLFGIIFTVDQIIVLDSVFKAPYGWLLPLALYFVVYLLIGYDVIWKALYNLCHGQLFDENFLMMVATVGAFALAIYRGITGQPIEGFDEACAVLLFYQVGEWFQMYATGKSRKSIAKLMDIRPDYANLRTKDGLQKVDPSAVQVGDIFVVNPGEKIPLDGVIVQGTTTLDTKALTGESLPRDVGVNQEVISGCVNLTAQIEVKATKVFYDSTVAKILDLVENASSQKSKAENFITKFARYYTPAVVVTALLLAVIPGFVTGAWAVWCYRALSFLVVSCPCALVISIPLSFFAGLGACSKYGILVKGSNYLERFNQANIFVFDKTGTLTKGNFAITKVTPENKRDEILRLAAIAEQHSNHPIARSIVAAYGGEIAKGYTLTNVAGAGVIAVKGAEKIYCGNQKLLEQNKIKFTVTPDVGTVVYVAKNNEFVGSILIQDEIRSETVSVVNELSTKQGRTIMLTGDNPQIAARVAGQIGLSAYLASLLPENKVEAVTELLANKNQRDVVCFVGDGINDAPVLMRADVGVAMGGVGSDAAIEAADIVLMQDDLRGIPLAKRIARKTMAIVRQNIWFSLLVKLLILVLSAVGLTNMWFAVFGDVGVAVLAILNAMRVNGNYQRQQKKRIQWYAFYFVRWLLRRICWGRHPRLVIGSCC